MIEGTCVHGVGTLLEVGESMHMVVGYRMIEENGHPSLAYLTVPYPLGYMSVNDISLMHDSGEHRVVYEGYSTEEQQRFVHMLVDARDEGEKTDMQAYVSAMNALLDARLGGLQDE